MEKEGRLIRFRGSYRMSPAHFRECSLALSYRQLSFLMGIFFVLLLILFGIFLWLSDMELMRVLAGAYSIMFLYMLFRAETAWKKSLRKRQMTMGEAVPSARVELGDRIYAHTPGRSEVAYTYSVVLGLLETEHYLILRMKYNLALMVEKDTLEGGTAEELTQFLFQRCGNMRRKRTETMRGKRPFCIFLTVLTMGLFLVCLGL